MLKAENNGETKAVVGGGAGSGLGPGHLATTLTSFNVSAIANPMSLESPTDRTHAYHQNDDIGPLEKQELYQQVIQLEQRNEESEEV